jgi:hypothetical protein
MTNLEKMNELVGASASTEEVINWAYANRIHLSGLSGYEPFESMDNSIMSFYERKDTLLVDDDEFKVWELFLGLDFGA